MNSDVIKIRVGSALVRLPKTPPLLSNCSSAWPGLHLEVDVVPAAELPPLVSFDRHLISASLGPEPMRRYWRQDGRERNVLFAPGDIGLISRQQLAGVRFDRPHHLLALALPLTGSANPCRKNWQADQLDFEMVPSVADPVVFRLLLLLKQEVALGCPTGRLYGESVANAIIYHTLSRYGTVKPILNSYHRGLSTPALRRVLEYVDEFLANNLAVADVASVAGLSQYHFAKLFRQSVGRPIHQYVLDLRIERARKLIEVGKMSLAAVGAQVGFPNPSQFSAMFRRRVGVSPREYSRLRGRPPNRTALLRSPFL